MIYWRLVLAIAAIPAVAMQARSARFLVWLFNVEGTLDLLAAIVLATAYGASAVYGARVLDPSVLGSSSARDALHHLHCALEVLAW